jgi:hypothetical protein
MTTYDSQLQMLQSNNLFNFSMGWKQGMPWLYYYNTADKVINDTQRIKFQVSFDATEKANVNRLQYFISK